MQNDARGELSGIPARYAAATGAQPVFLLEGKGGLFAAKWQCPRHRVANLWAPHHVIGYRVGGLATITRVRGEHRLQKAPGIGSVTFAPGDQPTEWIADAPLECIHLYISAEALRGCAVREFFAVSDPWLAAYFQLIDSECSVDPALDTLFLEQTRQLVLRHLVRNYSAARPGAAPLEARIAPLRASASRRIEEYIETHLGADVSLQVLAELSRMSVDHFVRAFRAATGKTPHRFVLERRLERAARMLREKGSTVAEIALACGFRSAAHFSVKFRARFGVTPTQYRRSA